MQILRQYRTQMRLALLDTANVDRLHIVGAARSGTTMLHYAMGAFQNALLHPDEANPIWHPSLLRSLKFALSRGTTSQPILYVTKRNYNWYADHVVHGLASEVVAGKVAIINLVRDPRDTLTSRHANHDSDAFYLEPWRWVESVRAGERLFSLLPGYDRKLTLRYEDLVLEPDRERDKIERAFGLTLDPSIDGWGKLATHLHDRPLSASMAAALHKVRDFDAASIG